MKTPDIVNQLREEEKIGILSSAEISEYKEVETENKSEESFKISNKDFRDFIKELPIGFFATDINGNLYYWNDKLCEITGLSKDEIRFNGWLNAVYPDDKEKVFQKWNKSVKTRTSYYLEHRFVDKKGKITWAIVYAKPKFNKEKELTGFFGNITDISDIKKTENKIRESEKRFQNVVFCSADWIWEVDKNGKYVYCSDKIRDILGYSPEEIIGKTLFDLMPKNEAKRVGEIFNEIVGKKEKIIDLEKWIISKNGKKICLLTNGIPILDENGNLEGYIGVDKDITDKKNVDDEIRKSRDQYRNLFNAFPEPAVIVSSKGKILGISDSLEEIIGYTKADFIGKNFLRTKLMTKKSKAKAIKSLMLRFAGVSVPPYTVELIAKDGKKIITEITGRKINYFDKPADMIILRNITKKIKNESIIKEYENRYSSLFKSSQDLIYINDFKGNFIDANDACFKLLGYTKEELSKINYKTLLDKGQLLKAFKVMKEVKKKGFQEKTTEFRLKCKDGSFVDVENTSSLIYRDGEPYALQGIARNITERRKTQEELEKLASIVKHSNELVNLADLDGNMVFLNNAGRKITGINPDDVQKHSILEVIPDNFKEKVNKEVLPAIMKKGSWEGELDYKNLITGNITKVHAMTFMIKNPETDKPMYLANVSLDITNEKKAEEQLYKAHEKLKDMNRVLEKKVEERTFEIKRLLNQKDEFINQLGHDLKNPLNPLVNLLPILEKTEKDLEMKKMLGVVNRNVGYMKILVVKTIELARLNSQSTKFNIEDTNLLSELKSIIETNKYMFEEKDIEVINNVSGDIQISADKLRLDELFNNLFNNSVKYSDGKGTITINAKPDESFVKVSVSDTGIGMTSKQLGHVFDEFYKADESRHDFDSSGLGMSICKKIVERHGGRIWAESKGIGKGSTFYFTLPKSSITNIEKPEKESVKEKKYDKNAYH